MVFDRSQHIIFQVANKTSFGSRMRRNNLLHGCIETSFASFNERGHESTFLWGQHQSQHEMGELMEINIYLCLQQTIYCVWTVAMPQFEKILAALMIVRSSIFQRDSSRPSMQFVSSEFHDAKSSRFAMGNDGNGEMILRLQTRLVSRGRWWELAS